MSASGRWRASSDKRKRVTAVPARQDLRVFERAVGHQQPLDAGVGQMSRGQFDGVAGADQQHAGLVELGEHLPRQPHGGEGH